MVGEEGEEEVLKGEKRCRCLRCGLPPIVGRSGFECSLPAPLAAAVFPAEEEREGSGEALRPGEEESDAA